jgi:beta-glucosidase
MRKTLLLALLVFMTAASPAFAQQSQQQQRPWMNQDLSPDERAGMVLKQLTLDEKIDLLHGQGMPDWGKPMRHPELGNGGAGFVLGVPRLGIPIIQMSDAAYGVRDSAQNGRYSTALPSNLASAASWDPRAACAYGTVIGRELRAQGYNMSLGGGVNLTREPRDGRTFEYMGDDPILAGTMVGNRIKCEQAQHVIADIKHYAMNDQESGRDEVNVIVDDRAMRESDLLAFQIGIATGDPAAVMCAYNAVNGDYSCQNRHLLTDILKQDWKFKGFVLSDWGGTHSTVHASSAGLDNEEPMDDFYGQKLKDAVQAGTVPMEQLDDHVRRILRSEFASGIVDHPMQKSVVDVEAGFNTARQIAEQSIVLLKNAQHVLPLDAATVHSIAIIGPHADTGMISGGGSAQVDPPGSAAFQWNKQVWFPTSPLKAVSAKAPAADVRFDSGENPASAAALARRSDVAIVFVYQWMSEGSDLPSLSLPDHQDELIEQVSAANPRTIVVLETGTAVLMPWLDHVSAVVEAWYAGTKGADAVANVLFGDVNPSGKLPITFPRSEADLPHPHIATPPPGAQGAAAVMKPDEAKPTFSVDYGEGLEVGYKWYDAQKKSVLFPFGFGLSYTNYRYSDLQIEPGSSTVVSFTVQNSGSRAGAEVAEVYAELPVAAGEPPKRLIGWSKVQLKAGESRQVRIAIDPLYLSIYDVAQHRWNLVPGRYDFKVGASSTDLPLTKELSIK